MAEKALKNYIINSEMLCYESPAIRAHFTVIIEIVFNIFNT